MVKDGIERDERTGKLMDTAGSAEDPLRALAELLTDFVMEAEVTAKVGAEVQERTPSEPHIATGTGSGGGTRGWER